MAIPFPWGYFLPSLPIQSLGSWEKSRQVMEKKKKLMESRDKGQHWAPCRAQGCVLARPASPSHPGSAFPASDLGLWQGWNPCPSWTHAPGRTPPKPCLECSALVIPLPLLISTANATHPIKSFLNWRARLGHFFTKAFCTHLSQILFWSFYSKD